jgi:hypothetical protein
MALWLNFSGQINEATVTLKASGFNVLLNWEKDGILFLFYVNRARPPVVNLILILYSIVKCLINFLFQNIKRIERNKKFVTYLSSSTTKHSEFRPFLTISTSLHFSYVDWTIWDHCIRLIHFYFFILNIVPMLNLFCQISSENFILYYFEEMIYDFSEFFN